MDITRYITWWIASQRDVRLNHQDLINRDAFFLYSVCLSVSLSLSLSFSLSLSLFLSYVSELPYYNDRLNMEACHLCDTTARNDVKRDTRGISLTFDAMSENMKHTEEK